MPAATRQPSARKTTCFSRSTSTQRHKAVHQNKTIQGTPRSSNPSRADLSLHHVKQHARPHASPRSPQNLPLPRIVPLTAPNSSPAIPPNAEPVYSWWSQTGSNRRPHACKARALPTELWPRQPKKGPGTRNFKPAYFKPTDLPTIPPSTHQRRSRHHGGPGKT